MGTLINLNAGQISMIRGYVLSGDISGGYSYVQSIIDNANTSGNQNMTAASTWFGAAAEINGNYGFFGPFARGYLETVASESGITISDSQFQSASDSFGANMLNNIAENAAIPDTQTIIPRDVENMEDQLGVPQYAWPGTLADAFFFNNSYTSVVDPNGNPINTASNFLQATDGLAAGFERATNEMAQSASNDLSNFFSGLFGPNGMFSNMDGPVPFPTDGTFSDGPYAFTVPALFGPSMADPLVLDLVGNGVQLIPLMQSNAFFDLYNTGYAVHTGWVGPETGVLVNEDGDGTVSNITDLFGSSSTDGFTALEGLDTNHDGVINAGDPGFANLEVWTDANGNGVADPGELHSLASLGITSINLTTENVNQTDGDNLIAEVATYTRADGTTGEVAEAYFDNSQVDSRFEGSYQLNPIVLTLPNLRGYGTLPDLYIAMSLDPTLLQMVQSFAGESLANAASFASQVRAILFQWAGVENVAPNSRGSYMDAQELGVLEKFTGEDFVSRFTGGPDPSNWHQGEVLQGAFDQLLTAVEARLLVQGPFSSMLAGVGFNYDTDSLVGSTDLSTLANALANATPTETTAAEEYWTSVAPMIGLLGSALGLSSSAYEGVFQPVFSNLNLPFTVDQAVQRNVLLGNGSTDLLVASNVGPHFFDGGAGVRYEQSDGGGDVFLFNPGYGNLEINECDTSASDNVLKVGSGITSDVVAVTLDCNQDFVLTIGTGGDQIKLDNAATGNLAYGVDQVQFADGTVWTQAQLIAWARNIQGTSGDDTLYGTNGADTFDGKGGKDFEIGRGGGDTFIFNAGYGDLEIDEVDFSAAPNNVLQLGGGISESTVKVKGTSTGALVLTDAVNGDQITLDNAFNGNGSGVQQVQFADGTTWSGQQLIQMALTGTSGNDWLYGTPGANVFDGKGGNDYEAGSGGNDTFVFDQGYGHLEIFEDDPNASANNVLQLGAGIAPSDVRISVNNDLGFVLTVGSSGDQIQLDDMAGTQGQYGVQTVQFADSTVWTAGQIRAWASDIQGTSGSDVLTGTGGADVFDGKGGNDLESGHGGNDTFVFNQGYGSLEINEYDESGSNNVLRLGAGLTASTMAATVDSQEDVILTEGSDQIKLDDMAQGPGLWGDSHGVQRVQFADGTVWTASQILSALGEVQGTLGDDKLYGTGVANLFNGEGGNDYEAGGGGNDTFLFDQGYGKLEINEYGALGRKVGTVQLGAGITPSSVTVMEDSNQDIVLTIGMNGDQIKLDYMASTAGNYGYGVQQVQFADGMVWTASQILASVSNIQGTTGNDVLYGSSMPDVFDGKGGNDIEIGTGNNDTFVFNQGYGHLEISDSQRADNATNVLLLGPGISEASITAKETADYAVVLTDGISGDQITLDAEVDDSLDGNDYGVQMVQFADGTTLTSQQLLQMAMAGTTGNDVLIGGSSAAVFDGKGGNDDEQGGGNGDTFVFNAGYGHLEIGEISHRGATNVLQLGASINESSLTVSATTAYAVVLTDAATGDQVILDEELEDGPNESAYGVQTVEFADGTTWSAQQLAQMAKTTTGTSGNDLLIGGLSPSVFDGRGGTDVANGGGNGDTFIFNAGYGSLAINENSSGAINVLQLGAGISEASVKVTATLDDSVVLTDGISGDRITLENELTDGLYGEDYGVQEVQFADGTTWSQQQLLQMAMTTTGTPGADVLISGSSVSVFDGKGGDDYESGGGNGDTFLFDAGYGHLEINEFQSGSVTNVLQFGAGINESSVSVSVDVNEDILLTSAGDQVQLDYMADGYDDMGVQQVQFADGTIWSASQIMALASNVKGTTGNDTLYGTLGSNTFDGKGGHDVAYGNGDNDTFIFNEGYGHLEINEWGSFGTANVLQLGAGLTESTMKVTVGGESDVLLTEGTNQIQLDAMDSGNSSYGVQEVQFADGTIWTANQILAWANAWRSNNPIVPPVTNIQGIAGNDTLSGTLGADRFDGRGGNDVEIGGGGADTFVFNQGYGHLEIDEFDSTQGVAGKVLKLGPEIVASSVAVSLGSNQDVILTIGTNGDQVQLDGMANGSGEYGVQQVQFADGTVWTTSQMIAQARKIGGTTGNDTLTGTNGADTLDGKGGNDVEIGNGGADTFIFNQGYGHLEINETNYYPGVTAVLQLGAGITESSVTVTATSSHGLMLADGLSGDQVTLDNGLYASSYGVQQVQFADGATWSRQQLLQMATTGTTGADTLYGTPGVDLFDGKGGGDVEIGAGGADTYVLQPGYGALTIDNGNAFTDIALGELQIDSAAPQDIWLKQVGNNLQIDVMGSSTAATIENWYSNDYSKLSAISVTDGTTSGSYTIDAQLDQLVQAMASYAAANPGFDPTSPANPQITDTTLLAAVNSDWHH